MTSYSRRRVLQGLGGGAIVVVGSYLALPFFREPPPASKWFDAETTTVENAAEPTAGGDPGTARLRATKVAAGDRDASQHFGAAVAMTDAVAVVGAPAVEEPNGEGAGAAYLFRPDEDGWTRQLKFYPDDGTRLDGFGTAVAASGGTVLAGAPALDEPSQPGSGIGSAYVFEFDEDGTPDQSTLDPEDGGDVHSFGHSVGLSGDTALVGAPLWSPHDDSSGVAAYLFRRSGDEWTERRRFTADDLRGSDVAVDGDTALIGATDERESEEGSPTGAVCVYERSGGSWERQAKLTPERLVWDDDQSFGESLALDGDVALVGAPARNGWVGAAHVYERDGGEWSRAATLVPDAAESNDRVGSAVAIAGDVAVVGARNDEDPNGESAETPTEGAGSAYRFERSDSEWRQRAKLAPGDGLGGDQFGCAVALGDDTALVGAETHDLADGEAAGAAYAWRLPGG